MRLIKFIQLQHNEVPVAKQSVVPALRMASHAVEPAGNGDAGVTGEAEHDGEIDAVSEKTEHHFDPLGRAFELRSELSTAYVGGALSVAFKAAAFRRYVVYFSEVSVFSRFSPDSGVRDSCACVSISAASLRKPPSAFVDTLISTLHNQAA